MAHSFETLIDDLSNIALNKARLSGQPSTTPATVTRPTRSQAWAYEILDVNPCQSVPISMNG